MPAKATKTEKVMPIECRNFGSSEGTDVNEYILDNSNGIRVHILDYGCIINQLRLPGRQGPADVVLGFDDLQSYLKNKAYMGAVVGRYANRIAGGRFTLKGTCYQLEQNEGWNHLHGGFAGFDRQHYQSEAYREADTLCVRLHRLSPHLEGGYPGNLDVTIIYRLAPNGLTFEVQASTDMATPVNVVQHSYFNLTGHDAGEIGNHMLQINADQRTEVDASLIPTGKTIAVAGTPFDFRTPSIIAARYKALAEADITGGFDCNFVLNKEDKVQVSAATLKDPTSGRTMEVVTNQPGLQFYDSSALMPQQGKGGHYYRPRTGLCLETQNFPDAVNHGNFPDPILQAGQQYSVTTTYLFSVD